jgi:hypothetical protein
MIPLYVRVFKRMWYDSFGTFDNVPQEFKDRVTAQYQSLKNTEKISSNMAE